MEGTRGSPRGGSRLCSPVAAGAAGLLRDKRSRRLGGSEEQSGLNVEQGNALPAPRRGCPLVGRPCPFARSALAFKRAAPRTVADPGEGVADHRAGLPARTSRGGGSGFAPMGVPGEPSSQGPGGGRFQGAAGTHRAATSLGRPGWAWGYRDRLGVPTGRPGTLPRVGGGACCAPRSRCVAA